MIKMSRDNPRCLCLSVSWRDKKPGFFSDVAKELQRSSNNSEVPMWVRNLKKHVGSNDFASGKRYSSNDACKNELFPIHNQVALPTKRLEKNSCVWEEVFWWYMAPRIGLPPNHPNFNRGFHYFHHPFWGFYPYFWKHLYLSIFNNDNHFKAERFL